MNKIKCLSVNVYKFPLGDCANGGVSGKFSTLLIPCDDGNETVDLDNPPENFCIVDKRILWGEKHYRIIPYALKQSGRWVMMGGNFAYTSDSRFEECTESWNPLPIHDRVED